MTAPFSNPARIIDLHHQGLSHRQIAQQLGCHHRTVQRHLEVNRKAREESEREAVRGWLEEKRRESATPRRVWDGEYEDDEIPAKVHAAWKRGEKFITAPPGNVGDSSYSFTFASPMTSNPMRVSGYGLLVGNGGGGGSLSVVTGHPTREVTKTTNRPRSGRWFRRAP